MGYQVLLVDRVDGVATVTMNRPEARNALDLTMREEMSGALDELERDPSVRDMIVASDRAKFGEVFLKIGLVPDGGGTWLLQRLVGLAKAKELVLTAEIIDAGEALRIGLVNRVVPAAELESATRALAAKIAAGPPLAAALAKSLLNRAATVDLAAALEGEAFGQSNAITSEDHAEGVRAFLEKRPAKFTGR